MSVPSLIDEGTERKSKNQGEETPARVKPSRPETHNWEKAETGSEKNVIFWEPVSAFQPHPDKSETLRAIGERRHAMVKSDKRRYPRTGATGKEAGGTLIWC